MNVFDIDYWLDVLHRDGLTLDKQSQHALMELFHLTDQIVPVGRDNRREFWITVRCGTPEEYRPYYDEDASEEELAVAMQKQYPLEEYWYKVVTAHHTDCRRGEYFGVFLNNRCFLTINDPNEDGNPFNTTELIDWLIRETKVVLEKLRNGTYNAEVREKLPADYRYGVISRKECWNIYPEEREAYRSAFTPQQIEGFLRCKDEFVEDYMPSHCLPHITVRDFYEACAICYRAIGLEPKPRCMFVESEKEHQRYSGVTPKELYYMFADGRDDGMSKVPLDDAVAFEEWLEQKGPYYEFNRHHPWEILPSYSTEDSGHLYVGKAPDGYYFSLSGSSKTRSREVMRCFLALHAAGLPVRLHEGNKMQARLEETDMIGIVPEGRTTRYIYSIMEYSFLDAVHLYDGDKPELVAEKAIWKPEIECGII